MEKKMRVLILEDVPEDAELMKFELSEAGISFFARRVSSEADFLRSLDDFYPDVILADYALPGFDGFRAMRIAAVRCPNVPLIIVSGAVGEETAIDLMKAGATDYVLKHRMARLAPAVVRATREADERLRRRLADEALEIKTRTLRETSTTLKAILRRWRGGGAAGGAHRVLANVRETVLPAIERLRELQLTERQKSQVDAVQRELKMLFALLSAESVPAGTENGPQASTVPMNGGTEIISLDTKRSACCPSGQRG